MTGSPVALDDALLVAVTTGLSSLFSFRQPAVVVATSARSIPRRTSDRQRRPSWRAGLVSESHRSICDACIDGVVWSDCTRETGKRRASVGNRHRHVACYRRIWISAGARLRGRSHDIDLPRTMMLAPCALALALAAAVNGVHVAAPRPSPPADDTLRVVLVVDDTVARRSLLDGARLGAEEASH